MAVVNKAGRVQETIWTAPYSTVKHGPRVSYCAIAVTKYTDKIIPKKHRVILAHSSRVQPIVEGS